jgi:predicted nucleotidyltransferase
MEYEMGLSVTRSKKTVSQASSSLRSQDSFDGSDKEVCVFKDASNKVVELQLKGNKNRASMMRKSNRISIADAINISEWQDLKKIVPLDAINSSSSVES